MSGPAQPETPDSDSVGTRLRELRLAHGLSARAVAERSGVDPGYLSRVETGKISPTVSTLTRLVQAMGESVGALFGRDGVNRLVRPGDRRLMRNRGVDDFLLTPPSSQRLEVLQTHIAPGAGSGDRSYTHPGDEECVVILDGELEMWLADERYQLVAGDALTFPCRTPHKWRNTGDEEARVLWIITPPGY